MKIRNSNIEIRNKHEMQMTETSQQNRFEHGRLGFRFCFVLRISCFGFVLLAGTPLLAAQQKNRYFAVPLPTVPEKTKPAVQLTGNETPVQLAAAYAHAIKSLLPGLAGADDAALFTLEATVHHAARPGAEAERLACCNAIAAILQAADTAPRVKSLLLHQLKVIGKAESVPVLVKLLADPDPHVASDAQLALDNNPACPPDRRSQRPRLEDRVRADLALRKKLLAAGDQAVPEMLRLLAGADPAGRRVALGMIPELGPGGRKQLAASADKLPPDMKAIVIESLADLDDLSVLPLARASLKSGDSLLRDAGLTALARLQGSEADNALLAGMNETSGQTKCQIIRIIAERGNHNAMPVLLGATADSDRNVVQAAYRAIGELAEAGDVPMLLEKFPEAAAKALARIAPDAGAEFVQAALGRAKDNNARVALLGMFRYCPGTKALAALQSALQDRDASLREAAVRTLAEWPDPAVLDTLVTIYQNPEKPSLGVVALRGIVRLSQMANKQPTPALVERYRQLLAIARNDDDRRRVLGALGGCGHVGALELAVAQLNHPPLRAEAAAAVKNIAALVRKQHPKEAKAALQKLNQ